jgi:CO/xanthine dehydrogenase FAD-binding subunit
MKFADFVIPSDFEEARAVLKKLGDAGYPVAGATAFQYLADRPGVTAVDISRLGFNGISRENGSFRIGANTTLTDLVRYQAQGWVLDRIATLIPTHQIRNISTVGGNIARLFPWSELPLGLLALDGIVVVRGDEERRVPAREFFDARPSRSLPAGDLITEVLVPAVGPGMGFGYKKEAVSNAAFALATAAAAITVDGGRMKKVRVALGSVVPAPLALPAVENALEGQPAEAPRLREAIEKGTLDVAWKGRQGMSDAFGKHVGEVVLHDALSAALEQATGGTS